MEKNLNIQVAGINYFAPKSDRGPGNLFMNVAITGTNDSDQPIRLSLPYLVWIGDEVNVTPSRVSDRLNYHRDALSNALATEVEDSEIRDKIAKTFPNEKFTDGLDRHSAAWQFMCLDQAKAVVTWADKAKDLSQDFTVTSGQLSRMRRARTSGEAAVIEKMTAEKAEEMLLGPAPEQTEES